MTVWAGMLWSAHAAASSRDVIDDQAGILNKETAQRVESVIQACREETGVNIQLITLSELYDQLQPVVDQELQKRPENLPVLLMMFGWGKDQFAIKPSSVLGRKYPVHLQTALIEEVNEVFADKSLVLSDRFEKAVQILADGYRQIHEEQLNSEIRYYPKDLFIALACVVTGAALLMWTALRWLQHSSARPREYYFPEVEVAMRLGAPHGGGTLACSSGDDGRRAPGR